MLDSLGTTGIEHIVDFEKTRRRYPVLRDKKRRPRIVESTINLIGRGFQNSGEFSSVTMKKKRVFKPKTIEGSLALYAAAKNIRRLVRPFSESRTNIVRCIRALAHEGTRFRIYRLDIKDFYESVDPNELIKKLNNQYPVSSGLNRILDTAVRHTSQNGLPRGLSISSVLAEFRLFDLDLWVKSRSNVFYYGRFVDDIVIFTDKSEAEETFLNEIQLALGSTLKLNKRKQKVLDFDCYTSNKRRFEYLGYSFSIEKYEVDKQNKSFRTVKLDIAQKKLKKIQTRIVRAYLAHKVSPNFQELLDRILILTSNYYLRDRRTGFMRKAGIYSNSEEIDTPSDGLESLDKFKKAFFTSGHKAVCAPGATVGFSESELNQLLGCSFVRGFEEKRICHFASKKLIQLHKCWRYE